MVDQTSNSSGGREDNAIKEVQRGVGEGDVSASLRFYHIAKKPLLLPLKGNAANELGVGVLCPRLGHTERSVS